MGQTRQTKTFEMQMEHEEDCRQTKKGKSTCEHSALDIKTIERERKRCSNWKYGKRHHDGCEWRALELDRVISLIDHTNLMDKRERHSSDLCFALIFDRHFIRCQSISLSLSTNRIDLLPSTFEALNRLIRIYNLSHTNAIKVNHTLLEKFALFRSNDAMFRI